MKCAICKEEIKDGAEKCHHCGSYVKKRARIWGTIKSVLQVCTFIAAIILLFFQQEQLNLQRKSVEELSKKFMEEKRPRIEIATKSIDFIDTGSVASVDFTVQLYNAGFADAEDLIVDLVLKFELSPDDTSFSKVTRIAKLTTARRRNLHWSIQILKPSNLLCLVDVRYTWKIPDLHYQEKRFFRYIYNEEEEKYSIRVLTENQVEKLRE